MPFYDYQCHECGGVQEAFQKMNDAPLEKCESCGGKLRKILHPVAVHFKGSGFYTTDYGKGRKKESDGYSVLEEEKYRRAEKGDPVCTRAVEADSRYTGSGASESSSSSSSSSGKDDKPKEKQKAT